jgi:hypothetical protein
MKQLSEIKAIIQKTSTMYVTVAYGSVIKCNTFFPKLIWFMEGYEFYVDLRVLKLR